MATNATPSSGDASAVSAPILTPGARQANIVQSMHRLERFVKWMSTVRNGLVDGSDKTGYSAAGHLQLDAMAQEGQTLAEEIKAAREKLQHTLNCTETEDSVLNITERRCANLPNSQISTAMGESSERLMNWMPQEQPAGVVSIIRNAWDHLPESFAARFEGLIGRLEQMNAEVVIPHSQDPGVILLRQRVSELQADLEAERQKTAIHTTRNSTLESEKEVLDRQARETMGEERRQVDQMRETVARYRQQRNEARKEAINDNERLLKRVEESNSKSSATEAELKLDIEDLQQALHDAQQCNQKAADEALQKQLDTLRESLINEKLKSQRLSELVYKKDLDIQKSKFDLNAVTADLTSERAKYNTLANKFTPDSHKFHVATLKADDVKAQRDTLRQNLKDRVAHHSELERQLCEKDTQIQKAKTDCNEAKRRNLDLAVDVANGKRNVTNLEIRINVLERQVSDLRVECNHHVTDVADKSALVDEREQRLAAVERRLEFAKRSISNLEAQLTDGDARIGEMQAKLREAKAEHRAADDVSKVKISELTEYRQRTLESTTRVFSRVLCQQLSPTPSFEASIVAELAHSAVHEPPCPTHALVPIGGQRPWRFNRPWPVSSTATSSSTTTSVPDRTIHGAVLALVEYVNDNAAPSLPWKDGFSTAWLKLQALQQALMACPDGSHVDKWLLQLAGRILVSMLQDANSAFPFRVAGCQILDIIGRRWPAAEIWHVSALGLAQLITTNDVWIQLVGKLCFNVDCPEVDPGHLTSGITANGGRFMALSLGPQSSELLYADLTDRSLRWIHLRQVLLDFGQVKLVDPWAGPDDESSKTLMSSSSLSMWMIALHLPRFPSI